MQKNKSINKEGIGLGLFITKNLATQLGGTISVDSEEGCYTRFVLTLPISHQFRKFKLPGASEMEGEDNTIDLANVQHYDMQVCNDEMLEQIKAGVEVNENFFKQMPIVEISSEPSSHEVNFPSELIQEDKMDKVLVQLKMPTVMFDPHAELTSIHLIKNNGDASPISADLGDSSPISADLTSNQKNSALNHIGSGVSAIEDVADCSDKSDFKQQMETLGCLNQIVIGTEVVNKKKS